MSNSNEERRDCLNEGFQRNHYYYGKLMTVRDFEEEQWYINEKRRLLNRTLQGPGIVCGLKTETPGGIENFSVQTGEEGNITLTVVKGGVVLDCRGNEIVVPDNTRVKPQIDEDTGSVPRESRENYLYLYLRYREDYAERVQAATHSFTCEDTCAPNRVAELFEVVAARLPPAVYPGNGTACPPIPDIKEEEDCREKLNEWLSSPICAKCINTGVFFLAIKLDDDTWNIDKKETAKLRSFIGSNRMLSELILHHMTDFSNPHNTGEFVRSPTYIKKIGWTHAETMHWDEFIKRCENGEFWVQYSKDVTGMDEETFGIALKLKHSMLKQRPGDISNVLWEFTAGAPYDYYLRGVVIGETEKGDQSKKRYTFGIDPTHSAELQSLASFLKGKGILRVYIRVKCDFILDSKKQVTARPHIGEDPKTAAKILVQNKVLGGEFETWVDVELPYAPKNQPANKK
ncbi:MAG: hypothetical protein GY757_07640 [bacterium]|nr:hypothetical protein [bacterium]